METQNKKDDVNKTDSYTFKLIYLDQELSEDNIKSITFLCLDQKGLRLPKLVNITKGTELFKILEENRLLGHEDLYFLAECLEVISRKDLYDHILDSSDLKMEMKVRGGSRIPSYRKLLFDICEDLDYGEVRIGVYLYDKIPKFKRENITTGMDFFLHLEQVIDVTVDNFNFLKKYFQYIGRVDLQEKVQEFLKSRAEPEENEIVADSSLTPQVETYRMDRKPRGICVIIDNEKFTYNADDHKAFRKNNRTGSEVDREKLKKTFSNLSFVVEGHVHKNLSAEEMVRTMTGIAININHSQYDCFVACILSHGVKDHVFGADGKLVPIRELTRPFKDLNCSTLIGKPRLFFIQACQGRGKQIGTDIEHEGTDIEHDAPETDIVEEGSGEVLPEQDFLLSMSTLPGFVSYRHKELGSCYITKLCESLDQHAYEVYLVSLLIMVNREVGKSKFEMVDAVYKQSPAPLFTLTKEVKFTL